ncbi:MAG TPA: hypothetical protein VFT74_09925, partial [Isosphaeraceae bacterium]|nr:hypothetical protein [Isosphaeraceae bacterium]
SMFIFQISPKTRFSGEATFSVKSPELRHYLVLYKPYTREVLAKVSLSEALKQLSHKEPKGHTASGHDPAKSS